MKLVAGLGNPGSRYEKTRHNVGFRVIDELARRWGIGPFRQQFSGLAAAGRFRDEKVLLVKPMTFMNRSGQSVREALTFHKLEPADLLVVVDDMALPLGRVRLRPQGSAGGHNGLTDIIQQLGTDAFARLRIGIEQVAGEEMVGHVLSPFSREEEEIVGPAVVRAADATECWAMAGVNEAMSRFNRTDDQADKKQE